MIRRIKYIVIHSTQTDFIETSKEDFLIQTRYSGKRSKFHFLIDREGNPRRLMGMDYIADWDFKQNDTCFHIAYLGGKRGEVFGDSRSPYQYFMLDLLIEHFKKVFPRAKVVGIDNFFGNPYQNPGFELNKWQKEFWKNPVDWISYEPNEKGKWIKILDPVCKVSGVTSTQKSTESIPAPMN